jgi:hypothetical protein
MSNLLADPLFVRAEVDYRLEQWGVAPHGGHRHDVRHAPLGWRPRLRRRRRPASAARPVAVARPRHP